MFPAMEFPQISHAAGFKFNRKGEHVRDVILIILVESGIYLSMV